MRKKNDQRLVTFNEKIVLLFKLSLKLFVFWAGRLLLAEEAFCSARPQHEIEES